MHKYQPRVHVIRKPENWDGTCDKLTMSPKHTRTFAFPETVFIAVTAYQNQLVSSLFITVKPRLPMNQVYSQSYFHDIVHRVKDVLSRLGKNKLCAF